MHSIHHDHWNAEHNRLDQDIHGSNTNPVCFLYILWLKLHINRVVFFYLPC